ncbi:hypothetical protein BJX70DRAFT_274755 [Aspergillus crustosus]
MFDLPGAKRVRRDDLTARNSSSPTPSPPPESAYPDAQKRLSALLNLDIAPQSQPEDPQTIKDNEDEEQEFEFRLFSAPAARSSDPDTTKTGDGTTESEVVAPTQKLRIRVRSPTPTSGAGSGEGRFVNPFRGWSYYFSTPGLLSGEKKKKTGGNPDEELKIEERKRQFEEVAVSGEELVKLAGISWPGCHLPWRVTRLRREHTKLPKEEKAATSTAITCVVETPERVPLSRKKPGKKRRIQLRKRIAAAEKTKETEAEKRNRRNREKKIKRRQKARELKAATAGAGGDEGETAAMEVDGDVSGEESD